MFNILAQTKKERLEEMKTYRKVSPVRIADENTLIIRYKNGKEVPMRVAPYLSEMGRAIVDEARREDVARVDLRVEDSEIIAVAYFYDDGTIGEVSDEEIAKERG